jgi:hypothetical protein
LRRYLLTFTFLAISIFGFSQTILDTPVLISESAPLTSFLIRFEEQHEVKFFFADEWLQGYSVDAQLNGRTLKNVLTEVLLGSEVTFELMFDYAVIFRKDPAGEILRDSILRTAAAAKKDIEERVIGDRKNYQPGKQVVITGLVKDEFSSLPLSGVVVVVNDKQGSETDADGRYKLTLQGGEYVIGYRYVNYREKVIDLKVYSNGVINVVLEETPIILDEVVVSDQAILNRRVGQSSLRLTDVRRSPTFLGERDVIKQIQNQPGVTTVGEVASGFNVRGGGVDQNLVLYDGVPIFNTAHAFGFFTAFNSDALSQVTFYRGGIPAEFGGRVSSVLNITSKEGGPQKWTGGGGIGIISSYLTAGGPIRKDSTTINASFRTSYSDWALDMAKSNYRNIQNSSLSFYDGSVKFAHKFTARTKLTASGYTSLDRFSLLNDTLYNSRNIAVNLQLDHALNSKLFSSVALSFGKYAYKVQEEDPATASELEYSITYPSLKFDFNYDGTHKLSFGLHNTFYDFNPGSLKPGTPESNARDIDIRNERSLESALYFSDAFNLEEDILIEAGMRLSIFNRIGPGTVYKYAPDKPMETWNITDSTQYSSGEIMKTYFGLEPRLSVKYSLGPDDAIKLGYNRMFQYLHLVSNTAAVTPVDVWQSSNSYFKPQVADQISLGYYRNLKEDTYEAFAEVFYKSVQNVLDFKDGANLILNKHLETALLKGKGKSYGIETSVSKIKGRLQGSVSYTFSRSWRKIDGRYSDEKINKGDWYPSNYDQPHVTTVNWRYGISRRIFFSGTFTYRTGRPMSLPVSSYEIDGVPVLNFSDRNLYRIPDYHRLDVAFIIEGNHKRKKLWDGTWVVSFYNAYGRRNAYSVFFQDDGRGDLKPYKLSVIGSIVPSLSYSFKF